MSKVDNFLWLLNNFEQSVADNYMDKNAEAFENSKYYKNQLLNTYKDTLNNDMIMLEFNNFIKTYECLTKEAKNKINKQIFEIAEYITDLEWDK